LGVAVSVFDDPVFAGNCPTSSDWNLNQAASTIISCGHHHLCDPFLAASTPKPSTIKTMASAAVLCLKLRNQ
jgi:hypothetical protein